MVSFDLVVRGLGGLDGRAAIGVSGGRITALGDERDARSWTGSATQVFDAAGGFVVAGLTDAHFHPVMGLDFAVGVDLSSCRDLDTLRTLLIQHAAVTPGEWVIGWGLSHEAFRGHPIDAAPLTVVPDHRPVYVSLYDGHAGLANAEALRRAGVTGSRELGSTAAVVVDEGGRPTGLLQETEAMDLVRDLLPTESRVERVSRLAGILDAMAATGLTGGHVMDCRGDSLDLLSALEESGRLPLRLRLHPVCSPDSHIAKLVARQATAGKRWRVAGIKFYLDGTIDGGTAWLSHPDTHGESNSPYWSSAADYAEAVRLFDAAGVPTATHAIGDAAVDHVLDTINALPAASPVRHRIEHLEYLRDDQIERFRTTRAVVSMQPTHMTDYVSPAADDNWSRRLGAERAHDGWRFGEIAGTGAVVALGSDWPVAPYDPRPILAAAQLRRPAGRPDQGVIGTVGLSPAQALAGYTSSAAYAAGVEVEYGRVAIGFAADLTILGADPLTVAPDEWPEVPVLATVVDGQLYRH